MTPRHARDRQVSIEQGLARLDIGPTDDARVGNDERLYREAALRDL